MKEHWQALLGLVIKHSWLDSYPLAAYHIMSLMLVVRKSMKKFERYWTGDNLKR